MSLKNYIYTSLLLVLFSCKEEVKLVTPICHFSEDEFVNVMVDYSLVKSAKSLGRRDLKYTGIHPSLYLFDKYGIDSTAVQDNLVFYTSDPKKAKAFYRRVLDSLEIKRSVIEEILFEIESKNDGQITEKDSINSILKEPKNKSELKKSNERVNSKFRGIGKK